MLKISNLLVKSSNNIIINDINLDINEGDVVCILGQNGQGKSTLLKSLMGFSNLFDITGSIQINGQEIINKSIDYRSNIGLFLSYQDPIEISGIKMIDYYRTIFQKKYNTNNILKMYSIFENILKVVELNQDFLSRSINDGFSGGEKKKNEIAQMLLLNPNIIMLDEIDSGLDFDTTNLIINILKHEINKKKTIIFISHNLSTIKELNPNKVVLLANKKIVALGDINLAIKVFQKGYKKTLLEYGVKEEAKVVNECIGGHFNAK